MVRFSKYLFVPLTLIFSTQIFTDEQKSTLEGKLGLMSEYYAAPLSINEAQKEFYGRLRAEADWSYQSSQSTYVNIHPVIHADSADDSKNSVDLLEAYWSYQGARSDFKVGYGLVFWGVTESRNIVNIINQSDIAHDIWGGERLGQPLVNYNQYYNFAKLELYWLPYFRERTYPGEESRLRFPLLVATEDAQYESSNADRHQDLAVRASFIFENMELSLSHFYGTARDPYFSLHEETLIPNYEVVHLTGVEALYIRDNWQWKLEAQYQADSEFDFWSSTAGVEYTVQQEIGGTDIALFFEYLADSRDESVNQAVLSKHAIISASNDTFIGTRISFNNVATSSIEMALIVDNDSGSNIFSFDYEQRIFGDYTLSLNAQLFSNFDRDNEQELLYWLRQDDSVSLTITRYFQ